MRCIDPNKDFMISTKENYHKHYVTVHGLKMAYIDEGAGNPILFLHGNPTSSYLWRNVIPHLVGLGRCIAPDLIGMGDSDKLPNSDSSSYRFVEHRKYLDAFLEALNIRNHVTLVIHDWGSALGFDWAFRHQHAVHAIAYMESFVKTIDSWDELSKEAGTFFQTIRSDVGEQLVLDNNLVVENILPSSILRKLSDSEMANYRRPFANQGESRRPTLTWLRQVPIANDPQDVYDIIHTYSKWLATSQIPKLFIESMPGVMFESHRNFAKTFLNQTHVQVSGSHFVQEDSPHEIGEAIAAWLLNHKPGA